MRTCKPLPNEGLVCEGVLEEGRLCNRKACNNQARIRCKLEEHLVLYVPVAACRDFTLSSLLMSEPKCIYMTHYLAIANGRYNSRSQSLRSTDNRKREDTDELQHYGYPAPQIGKL
ncbi:hypothetical protein Q9233_017107 [Columba guinea]|nr:hypothetical protein Q9233_017107 [Columba guinea]